MITDNKGNVVSGIKKSTTGLVVDDKNSYNKYLREKETLMRITNLEKEVESLKRIITSLLGESDG